MLWLVLHFSPCGRIWSLMDTYKTLRALVRLLRSRVLVTAGTVFVLFLRFVGLLARTLFVRGEETQPFGCVTFKNIM